MPSINALAAPSHWLARKEIQGRIENLGGFMLMNIARTFPKEPK